MTTVLVHGNPETTYVWSRLVPELEARGVNDIVTLSPPGFGASVPEGFTGTRLAHRDWLIKEIENLGGNVDLIGHDWGAGHVYAVAAERPDLLRTWAADCAGLVHPDYAWHPAAAVWQTEGAGEESIASIIRLDSDELGAAFGVPPALAPTMAEHLDETMGDAILKVYRSAVQPAMSNLGIQLTQAPRRPSLLIHPTADPFVPPAMVHPLAEKIDSDVLTLEGLGHWWMFEDPAQAAEGLVAFWAKHRTSLMQ